MVLMRLLASLMLVIGATAYAQDQQTAVEVEAKIFDGNRLVGQPRVVAAPGRVVVLTADKEGGYRLRLTAFPATEGGGATVSSNVELREGGRWELVAQPTLTLDANGTGSVKLRRSSGGLFRMEVRVRPVAGETASR